MPDSERALTELVTWAKTSLVDKRIDWLADRVRAGFVPRPTQAAPDADTNEPPLVAAARAAASRMVLRAQRPLPTQRAKYPDEDQWPSFSDDVTTIAQALGDISNPVYAIPALSTPPPAPQAPDMAFTPMEKGSSPAMPITPWSTGAPVE